MKTQNGISMSAFLSFSKNHISRNNNSAQNPCFFRLKTDTTIWFSHKWTLNKNLLKHFLWKCFVLKCYPCSTVYIHIASTQFIHWNKLGNSHMRKSYYLKLLTGTKEQEISFCSVCLGLYLLKMSGVYQSCCSL